jgi:hypothetical protein
MANYCYVTTLLPDLQLGNSPEISFDELDVLLRDNLTDRDYRWVILLRRYYDINNMRALWKGEPLDIYGNLDASELEDALIRVEDLPKFERKFLEQYESLEMRLTHFPELIAEYYRSSISTSKGFVKQYLIFERKLRLYLLVLRALRLKRDLSRELQYEDADEEMIQQLLLAKDSGHLEVHEDFEGLEELFNEHFDLPIDLHQAICQYRFDWIQNHIGDSPFSLDRVLGYMLQLIIVQKWKELDNAKDIAIIDRITND